MFTISFLLFAAAISIENSVHWYKKLKRNWRGRRGWRLERRGSEPICSLIYSQSDPITAEPICSFSSLSRAVSPLLLHAQTVRRLCPLSPHSLLARPLTNPLSRQHSFAPHHNFSEFEEGGIAGSSSNSIRYFLVSLNRFFTRRAIMDVDSQTTMEETILVGDDLMLGPPSPIIPPEIASHVLEGVDICDGILKNLFLCLQINDIEPFCQDEIVLYRQCAEKRDKEIRERLKDSEYKLGLSMPLEKAKERTTQLQSEVTLLERRLILASGAEGMDGFRQRWSLHGRLEDTKKRLEALNQGMAKREIENPKQEFQGDVVTKKKWFFF